MSEISTNATVRATSVRSRRDQRTQRYREIASILWDERILSLFKDTEVREYAPDGASLEEVADDAPELEGRRRRARFACVAHSSASGRRT